MTNVPLVVTMTKSPTGITIYCRATAKSKVHRTTTFEIATAAVASYHLLTFSM